MDFEEFKDLVRRKAMAVVGTRMTNDAATRRHIAKNLGLEIIEPENRDSEKQE
jgi:hypothetical protein